MTAIYIPKRYGQSKIDRCPFCGGQAFSKNPQGIPVCSEHKTANLPEMRCACGRYLERRDGKFGVFFSCMNCGAISMKKALDVNDVKAKPSVVRTTTDDPTYFD